MDVQEVLNQLREEVGPRHVFGEPIREGDTVVVPVAKVRGGGGGGGSDAADGKPAGRGIGFGITAIPTGAFVIRQGRASWRPAVDVNRMILGGQIVASIALLIGGLSRLRRRRRLLPW